MSDSFFFRIIFHFFSLCFSYRFVEMWNIGFNSSRTYSLVRNLYWEGYYFYAGVGAAPFGGAYFGLGLKNPDLAFMF